MSCTVAVVLHIGVCTFPGINIITITVYNNEASTGLKVYTCSLFAYMTACTVVIIYVVVLHRSILFCALHTYYVVNAIYEKCTFGLSVCTCNNNVHRIHHLIRALLVILLVINFNCSRGVRKLILHVTCIHVPFPRGILVGIIVTPQRTLHAMYTDYTVRVYVIPCKLVTTSYNTQCTLQVAIHKWFTLFEFVLCNLR